MAVDGYPALGDLTPEALRRVTVRPLSQVSEALGGNPLGPCPVSAQG